MVYALNDWYITFYHQNQQKTRKACVERVPFEVISLSLIAKEFKYIKTASFNGPLVFHDPLLPTTKYINKCAYTCKAHAHHTLSLAHSLFPDTLQVQGVWIKLSGRTRQILDVLATTRRIVHRTNKRVMPSCVLRAPGAGASCMHTSPIESSIPGRRSRAQNGLRRAVVEEDCLRFDWAHTRQGETGHGVISAEEIDLCPVRGEVRSLGGHTQTQHQGSVPQ